MLQPPSRLPRSTSTASLSRRSSTGATSAPGSESTRGTARRAGSGLPGLPVPSLRGLVRSSSAVKLGAAASSSPVPRKGKDASHPPSRPPASSVSSTSTTSASTTSRHPPIPRAQGLRHMSSSAGLRPPAATSTTASPTPTATPLKTPRVRTASPSTTTPATNIGALRPKQSYGSLRRQRSVGSLAHKTTPGHNTASTAARKLKDPAAASAHTAKVESKPMAEMSKINTRTRSTLPPALGGTKRIPLRSPFVEKKSQPLPRGPPSQTRNVLSPAARPVLASSTGHVLPSVQVSRSDPSPRSPAVKDDSKTKAQSAATATMEPPTQITPPAPALPKTPPSSQKLTPPSSPKKPPSSPMVLSPSSSSGSSPASSTPSPRKSQSRRSMAPSPSPYKFLPPAPLASPWPLSPSPQPPSPAVSTLSTTSTIPPFSARRKLFEAPSSAEPTTPRRSARAVLPETPGLSSYLKDNSARLGHIGIGDVSLASSGSFSQLTPPGFVLTDGESSPSPSPPGKSVSGSVRRKLLRSPLSPLSATSPLSPSPLSSRRRSGRPRDAAIELRAELERVKNERAALTAKVDALESDKDRLSTLAEAALQDRDRALAATDAANIAHEAALWDSVVQAATEAIAEEKALKAAIAAARTLVCAM